MTRVALTLSLLLLPALASAHERFAPGAPCPNQAAYAPPAGAVLVPGAWRWNGARYVWIEPHYEVPAQVAVAPPPMRGHRFRFGRFGHPHLGPRAWRR